MKGALEKITQSGLFTHLPLWALSPKHSLPFSVTTPRSQIHQVLQCLHGNAPLLNPKGHSLATGIRKTSHIKTWKCFATLRLHSWWHPNRARISGFCWKRSPILSRVSCAAREALDMKHIKGIYLKAQRNYVSACFSSFLAFFSSMSSR